MKLTDAEFRCAPLYRQGALIALVLVCAWISETAEAAFVTRSNTTTGFADASVITRSIVFTASDFGGPVSLDDVNVTISFAKTNNNAFLPASRNVPSGTPYFNEIQFILTSPSGTQVRLISNGSSSQESFLSGSSGFKGTITFDQSAPTLVNANRRVLTSGTFRPANPPNQSLNSFNAQDPLGTWTLSIGDDVAQDGLSFYSYSLGLTVHALPEPRSIGLWGSLALVILSIFGHRARRQSSTQQFA